MDAHGKDPLFRARLAVACRDDSDCDVKVASITIARFRVPVETEVPS
jgi:hypothetical protein